MMLKRPEGLFPSRTRRAELHAEEDLGEDDPGALGSVGGGARDAEDMRASGPSATRTMTAAIDDGHGPRAPRGVTKRFGGLVAVHDVDFTIPEGSIVSLIGPNGAGKTTFFNIIAGHLRPDRGAIEFRGRTMIARPAAPGWSRSCGSSRPPIIGLDHVPARSELEPPRAASSRSASC